MCSTYPGEVIGMSVRPLQSVRRPRYVISFPKAMTNSNSFETSISKLYFPKCTFAKCTRLTNLLIFASLLNYFDNCNNNQKYLYTLHLYFHPDGSACISYICISIQRAPPCSNMWYLPRISMSRLLTRFLGLSGRRGRDHKSWKYKLNFYRM